MTDTRDLEAARLFHDTYERLAPSFGYETRKETRQFDPESPNGKLMIAVCREVLSHALAEARDQMERITARSESALAMAREQLAEAQERAEEIVFSALHEVFAVCGHCGKRKCPERKSNSRLPDEIFKPVRAALDAATGGKDG